MVRYKVLAAVCFSVLVGIGHAFAEEQGRLFSVDDIFRVEKISGVASSPTGNVIAIAIKAPVESDVGNNHLYSNDRSDIWIYDRSTKRVKNLTSQFDQDSDYWHPVWSPGGEYLAMMVTPNSGTASFVAIWREGSGKLNILDDWRADIPNDILVHGASSRLVWISEDAFLYRAVPDGIGHITDIRMTSGAQKEMASLWARAQAGRSVSVDILESGVEQSRRDLSTRGRLIRCEVAGGNCSEVMSSQMGGLYDLLGDPSMVQSPTRTAVAVLSVCKKPIAMGGVPLRRNNTSYHCLDIVNDGVLQDIASVPVDDVIPGSLRWSPGGAFLAFVGASGHVQLRDERHDSTATSPYGLYVLNLATGRIDRVRQDRLFFDREAGGGGDAIPDFDLFWTGDERLVVAAERRDAGRKPEHGWWEVSLSRPPVNLTREFDKAPDTATPLADENASIVFQSEGQTSIFSSLRGSTKPDLLADARGTIVGHDGDFARGRLATKIRLKPDGHKSSVVDVFDVVEQKSLVRYDQGVNDTLLEFRPGDGASILYSQNDDGYALKIVSPADGLHEKIWEGNTFLEEISPGEVLPFDYETADGQPLKGWVLLPVGYEPGKRYPLVSWVYQGYVQNEKPRLGSISTANPLNMQLFAARGYAVLFPSMPGMFKDYHSLLDGVNPAIDELVRRGIADPDRLAVMGQSNGGFSTYGIITQTDRFKAAIAIAGMTDFRAIALQFHPPFSQRDDAFDPGPGKGRLVSMEGGADYGLPWSGPDYDDNSPISYVENVTTPILLVHGDWDGVPIQQAEEFFTAMHRLGKRARFLRYFGEEHVLKSPANIRHFWDENLAWFDAYLQ